MKALKWLGKTAGGWKWIVALLGVMQSLLALCGVGFALCMREAIDCAVGGDSSGFFRGVCLLAGLIAGQIVLSVLSRYLQEETRTALENRLRSKILRGVLGMEYRETALWHSGELMNRVTSDAAVVSDGMVSFFPSVLSMSVKLIGVLIVMYMLEPAFTWIFLAGGCLLFIFSLFPRKWMKQMHCRVQESDGKVRCFLQECMESLLIIHAFGCEGKMDRISREEMSRYRKVRRNRAGVSNLFYTALTLFLQGSYLVGFFWCGSGILRGVISYGTLAAVIQLIGQIQTPFVGIGNVFPKYSAMLASAERIMELTENHVKIFQEGSPADPGKVSAIYEQMEEICFQDVSFSYDADKQVLEKINFRIKKGELAALTGESGRGKSTLMKLLLSVYDPENGKIFLRMKDGELPVSKVGSGMFAYVPQGNHLMSGTIREVVGFAEKSENISDAGVEAACRAACAHEFIVELPKGYETPLGEKGAGLSEGQMQRLAVARAIYSECPVLLLDEATSALDEETEIRLMESLKSLENRTIILATHRKEIWQLCDCVLRVRVKDEDADAE